MSTARSPLVYTLLVSCAAALGGFLFGYDTSVVNGAIHALQERFGAGNWLIGLSVSLALLGAGVGAFFAGGLADRFGRVPCMVGASFLFLASSLGAGAPGSLFAFVAWRVLGGVGVGAASVIAPAYIAETAPAHLRGRLGSLQQLAIVSGIFAALVTNYLVVRLAGTAESVLWLGAQAWQWMFWLSAVPAALYAVCSLLVPESPRHLVATGRDREASAVLFRLGIPDVSRKIREIRESLIGEKVGGFSDLLVRVGSGRRLMPVVWAGIGLAVLQQLVGINVIFYYGSALWRSVGFSEQDSLRINVLSSVVNIATTLVAIATVDRFGRKPLLVLGSAGMTVSLAAMAAVFATAPVVAGEPSLAGLQARVALVAANAYIVFFGMSWGPVMWVMLGEMFPNRVRGAALALAGLAQWGANFLVSTTFLPLSSGIGLGGAYGIYALFSAASLLFVVRAVRETRGMELEEMT